MFSIVRLDFKTSFSIVILKSVFVLAIRAVTAFFMSFSGGMLSFIIMFVLNKRKASLLLISIFGGISHNIGQLICACLVLNNSDIFLYYAPVLIVTGCITGTATGFILENVLKYINYYGGKR